MLIFFQPIAGGHVAIMQYDRLLTVQKPPATKKMEFKFKSENVCMKNLCKSCYN